MKLENGILVIEKMIFLLIVQYPKLNSRFTRIILVAIN